MARAVTYLVFILPIVFSIGFGAAVLADVLKEPGRELNMWPIDTTKLMKSSNSEIQIAGIQNQHSISKPIEIQVKGTDLTLNCGDLYITTSESNSNDVISQHGFFEQCFEHNVVLPIGDEYSEIVDMPEIYHITAQMSDQSQKNTITISEEFTIK